MWDRKSLKETSFIFSERFATVIKNKMCLNILFCLVVSAKFTRFPHVLACVGYLFKKLAMANAKFMFQELPCVQSKIKKSAKQKQV